MKNVLLFLLLVTGISQAAPTAISVVTLSETAAALAETANDASNGNKILNTNCDMFMVLKNSHVSDSAVVAVTAQGTSVNFPGYGPMAKASLSITLTAGQEKHVGPFRCNSWNDSSSYVQLTYSGAASSSVKVSPLRLPTTF
jgi:hypothetical protein